MTTDLVDCRIIGGDRSVIISLSTAEEAYRLMKAKWDSGGYRNLFADDRSFISTSLAELGKAVGEKWVKP